ncbi:DUF4920 domain-containing protein [Marinicella gelatinilytica]|uniref:DUF4920 domain-containing protein n=1 Tax=Marinicella gelatinilytica TaxID=2996017 RepID=UPI00226082F0|nr:DUF4920 domain-containing protein [Marinicella gelatinilytica]MCX7543924.1 DUF4920 domain-containing protein [Marinicella gelatinilytica]
MMLKKYTLIVLFMLMNFMAVASSMQGQPAPVFNLKDQNGEAHQLADYDGQWLVLYFYPKDGTSGCTVEANEFKDNYQQLKAMNTEVLGISLDDAESHRQFIAAHNLPFNLLVDSDKVMSRAYGVDGGAAFFSYAKRQTFIVNPEGMIARHFEEVDPNTHVSEVLAALDELQTEENNAEEVSNNDSQNHEQQQPVITEEIDAGVVYGDSWQIGDAQVVDVANALSNPEDYTQDKHYFKGEITQVCQKMGCWMMLKSGEQFVRVDFKNHSFLIPKDSRGQAHVHGQLTVVEHSPEKIAHFKAEGAGEMPAKSHELIADSVLLLN